MHLRLTKREVPDGSLLAVLSDVHIPHHDEAALRLVVECCESEGATHVLLNGDIADCGPVSRHAGKRERDVLDIGSLRESVHRGMWLFDWARTRPCWYTLGNHEAWVEEKIATDPGLVGLAPELLMGLPPSGSGWTVLPSGSRIRLGSLVVEHGDSIFARGTGGANPAGRILTLAPDQTTMVGHLHRLGAAWRTTYDEHGMRRTRAAFLNGHLSREETHESYAGGYPNWQQSFALVRVHYDDTERSWVPSTRFTVHQIEIHRDRGDRPTFEFGGRTYR